MTNHTVWKQLISRVLSLRNRYFFALDGVLLSVLPALALSLNRGDAGWWTDAGTFESLHRAANLVAEHGANRMDEPEPSLFEAAFAREAGR